jgi:glycosyltransferase involved in cell wall biosynthesis
MEPPKKKPGKSILYVVTKGNWGGAQRYVHDLATAAKAAGYSVAVAYGEPGLLETRLKETGIDTHVINSFQRDVALLQDLNGFREVYGLLKKLRPDVVHLNSSKAGGVGALAACFARIPRIIFTCHGLPWDEDRGALAKFTIYLATWATCLLSHEVVCVSRDNYERARKLPFCRNKVHLIYNGIDLHMAFGTGDIIRNAFPIGTRITGTVGELTKNKNQIALIEAARKDPSLFIAIVGEGELRGMLTAKIKEYGLTDRVKLFGFMPATEVMRGFDTFALPSIKEGLAYVVLEARVAGLPIEANRVGGVGEAIDLPLAEFSLQNMTAKTLALY